jgi:predicted DNA-binding transcriptional regulator AlpA
MKRDGDRRGSSSRWCDVNQEWLSRRQLSDRLGISVKTLADWAYKGTGPRYAKFGKHTRYRLSDVIDWKNGCFVKTER